jgi:membrane protease YdiL (CAAX protease family)
MEPKERLGPSDYRFVAVCLALLALTTWYTLRNFYRAFPEASIDFRVNRAEGQRIAERFLEQQGDRTAGYRQASKFDFDDDAKTFLEREAGLEQANRLMGTRVRLWRWSYRWFQPRQKEEFRADITTAGEFAGFSHELPEDAARPAATEEQARALAEDFLRSRVHRDPGSLDFVESSSSTLPKRTDWTFTWKERDFNLHDATLRREVTILGDEVGRYREFLKIPEQWMRDYERLRSKNNLAQTVDTFVFVLLLIGLIATIAMRVRRRDIRWRRAAAIGAAGMVLSLAASLNGFPLSEFGFPTTDTYSSFVATELLQALLSALGVGGFLFLLVAGAEAVYRGAYPQQLSVGSFLCARGLRTKRFFLGAILGLALTGIFFAYQVVFYMVATRLGAWAPAEVPYDDMLNTRFPWAFVLIGGFFPAVFEEFGFRMFAIPFLQKLTRWLPAAVLLAGFIWGFGHAGYPNQPFYIRGLEVGIGGVALGSVMLRWGILPTLIWHYSVDAMYTAMLLLRSHSLYFRLSGAASAGIFVLPVVAALVAYWRRGGFEPEAGLLNGDEPVAVEPPAAEAVAEAQDARHHPLGARLRLAAIAVLSLGALSLAIPVSHFGASPKYRLTADEARASSDAFLRRLGVDPGAYLHVTYPAVHWGGDDELAAKYFLERQPVGAASKLFERFRPIQHWATRYFKSLDKEEFTITVHPESGKVMGWSHQLPEDLAGADISADRARQIATSFAAADGLDVSAMDLKESESEKRKARRDYSLVWEARTGDPRNLDEAHYRVAIGVAGDRVVSLRNYWKIPEAFVRERSRQNYISIALLVLKIAVIAGGVVLALWTLIRNIRQGLVPWRRVLRVAAIPAAMTIVGFLLSAPSQVYRSYQTAIPLETFQLMLYVTLGIGALFTAVLYGAAAGFVMSCYPDSLAAFRAARRRVRAWDALFALVLAAGLWILLRQAGALLAERFHGQAIIEIGSPDLIGLPLPWLAAVAGAVGTWFGGAAVLAGLALAMRMLPRQWMAAPVVLLIAAVGVPESVRTPGELALEYGAGLAAVACAWAFCKWFARENYLAYAAVLWALALHSGMLELLGSGNPALQMQGWALAAVLAIGIVWMVAPAAAGERMSSGTPA